MNDRRSVASAEGAPADPGASRPVASGAAPPSAGAAVPLPAVEFHTFLLSLASSALLHLGEIEDPESGRPQRNLPMAQHTIDVLAMLEVKTKGNLTAAEAQLLESLLFDLRLRYVEAAKAKNA